MNSVVKMSFSIRILIAAIILIAAETSLNAQRIAITTNILEDVITTPNIGVDIVVADRQSITFDASYAPHKLSEKFHNQCMTFRAGYKYWLNQSLYAHYVGVDAIASSADLTIGRGNFRNEYIGVGVGYGYSFIIGKRLNIVPGIGVGVAYGKAYDGYDHMTSSGSGVQATVETKVMPILTRLSVTIQYVLK